MSTTSFTQSNNTSNTSLGTGESFKQNYINNILRYKPNADVTRLEGFSEDRLKNRLDNLKEKKEQEKAEKDQRKIDELKEPVDSTGSVSTATTPGLMRTPVYHSDILLGAPGEFASTIDLPTAEGFIDGRPYFTTSPWGLANIADNANRSWDLYKDTELTSLRGQISKELARYDAERSFRETMRSGLAQSLAGFMG